MRPTSKPGFPLNGEIFPQRGGIGIAIPPLKNSPPEAIPFQITGVWPATAEMPSWADGYVGDQAVRLNPDIIDKPLRLADCLRFAQVEGPTMAGSVLAEFQGEEFLFGLRTMPIGPSGRRHIRVIMIDTPERYETYGGPLRRGETEYKLRPGLGRTHPKA